MSAEALLQAARTAGLTLATAESCTGGGLGAALAAVPGASDVLLGGVIAYANSVKQGLLGVPAALLEAHGGIVYRDSALRGPCMNGISLGMLSAFLGEPGSIGRLMRLDEALTRRIYRRLIWDELRADRLPPGLFGTFWNR